MMGVLSAAAAAFLAFFLAFLDLPAGAGAGAGAGGMPRAGAVLNIIMAGSALMTGGGRATGVGAAASWLHFHIGWNVMCKC
ncbi:hypothetical protein JYU34_008079 [Plutella xylostella]|uniref:Uncharacterized protein n=1 Tax=Plutella xylostella TaxID=51655 RepID=A0ABQ7QNN7_PLUXY|nr:hypothetical protein JYU34_008079 [Plutella xylostella]